MGDLVADGLGEGVGETVGDEVGDGVGETVGDVVAEGVTSSVAVVPPLQLDASRTTGKVQSTSTRRRMPSTLRAVARF